MYICTAVLVVSCAPLHWLSISRGCTRLKIAEIKSLGQLIFFYFLIKTFMNLKEAATFKQYFQFAGKFSK